MIRILHIIGSMDVGGAETFIMNIYRNIDRNIIQFDFLVHKLYESDYEKEILNLGGKIFKITPRNQDFFQNRKDLKKFFETHEDYQIIHQHASSLSYIDPLIIAKKFGVKNRILHIHSTKEGGSRIHNILHNINKLIVDEIVTVYYGCSQESLRWIGKNNLNNDHIINNSIDFESFKFDKDKRRHIRKKYNLDNNFIIGHVGNFTPPKNHKFLIDLLYGVVKENKLVKMVLVGSGELEDSIKQYSKKIGVFENIIFIGQSDQVPSLLSAFDIFVFPSIYEGFPISLLEAQASGLECLVSNNVTKEIRISNQLHFLPIDNSVSVWVNYILEILNGKNSIEIERRNLNYSKQYDIKSVSLLLEKMYLELSGYNDKK